MQIFNTELFPVWSILNISCIIVSRILYWISLKILGNIAMETNVVIWFLYKLGYRDGFAVGCDIQVISI